MATVSEQLTGAFQDYYDNADYLAENSITKAKAFVTACTRILALVPSSTSKGSGTVSHGVNLQLIQSQLNEARKWLLARDPTLRAGPDVTFPDFQDYRLNYE